MAIYVTTPRAAQPLSASGAKKDEPSQSDAAAQPVLATQTMAPQQAELFTSAHRRKLPDERKAITHKFWINGHEGYITVGVYDDGTPGEVFIKMAKEGSTLSGVMDGFALTLSIGLQYGVPLRALVDKLMNTRFSLPASLTPRIFAWPHPFSITSRAGWAANLFPRTI